MTWPHLPHLTVLLCAVLLSNCVSYDPGYKELKPLAETNPDPKAIVGMWHRAGSQDFRFESGEVRNSLLFKSDGTAMMVYHQRGKLVKEHDQNFHFFWRYVGGGVWMIRWTQNGPDIDTDLHQIAQGKLLVGGYLRGDVWKRVK